MKQFIMFILFVCFQINHITMASTEIDISEEDLAIQMELNSDDQQTCVDDYRKWRNQMAAKAGLTPIVGFVGLVGNAALGLGWEYGGWFAFKQAIGPFMTSTLALTINHILPTTIMVGTVTYETVMISRFVKASKAFRLVKNLDNEENSQLDVLVRRVQKHRPDLSRDLIKERISQLNETRALCDGSLVTTSRFLALKKSLSRRMANLKDMERYLIKNG